MEAVRLGGLVRTLQLDYRQTNSQVYTYSGSTVLSATFTELQQLPAPSYKPHVTTLSLYLRHCCTDISRGCEKENCQVECSEHPGFIYF